MIERVPEELWTEVHDIIQEAGVKTIPKKKKCKKAKWLSEEALQIAKKRREVKGKGRRKVKVKVKSLSRVPLLAIPWTAAYQAPLSMGFSRQEYWSGLPLPSPKEEGKIYPFECRVSKNSKEK